MNYKQTSLILCIFFTTLSFAGICTRFLESWSHLSTERNNDIELLELCSDGVAAKSNFMRNACLNARSSKASPLLFKSVLRAVGIAYEEFTANVASPSRVMVLLFFAVSSFFVPLSSWLSLWNRCNSFEEESGKHHIVVMASDSNRSHRSTIRNRITGALQNRRRRVSPKPGYMDIELLDDEIEDHVKWA